MACVAIGKLMALVYAGVDSWRARFVPGYVGVGISLVILVGLTALPSYSLGADEAPTLAPWVLPLPLVAVSSPLTLLAFRAERREPELSERRQPLGRAAMGWLANALLDLSLLLIVGVGWYLATDAYAY